MDEQTLCRQPRAVKAGQSRVRSGSPPEIVDDLQAYVAAGVRHFVLDFSVPTVPAMLDVLERFAADVRPQVREPSVAVQ